MLRKLLWTILGIFGLLVVASGSFLYRGGAFSALEPHFDGHCTALPTGGPSAEDIQIDAMTGIAYLSAYDRRAMIAGEATEGTIYSLDLNGSELALKDLVTGAPAGFRPHGLSLYRDAEGQLSLYVINHLTDGTHSIEIFDATSTGLTHRRTVKNPLLSDPNDIVAVGRDQFFVANDTGAQNGFERASELLLARGLSPIVFFDGETMAVSRSDLAAASGINASLDGKEIYVAETLGERVRSFSRSGGAALDENAVFELDSGADNIDVAADGTLWVAAHANMLKLIQHFADANSPAPTQIWRVDPSTGSAETVYVNAGDEISAGSVGATHGARLLIGSITEAKVLVCQIASIPSA